VEEDPLISYKVQFQWVGTYTCTCRSTR